MSKQLKQLRVLTVAIGCGTIVLSAFLCGCESKMERTYREAKFHHAADRPEVAIAACKKCIAIKPDHADAYYLMGNAYQKPEQYLEAIAAYKKAIEIKPDYADAYFNMAITYYNSDKHQEAIAVCKKLIAIKPDYGLAYLPMGVAYEELEQYPEAIATYKAHWGQVGIRD